MAVSVDTNILFAAVETSNAAHARAVEFLEPLGRRDDVVISELALLELYGLLRNPAVMPTPIPAREALETCQAFRQNPRWQVVGLPANSRDFHDRFWPKLGERGFARRRAYDWRLALSLLSQGVDEFATANTRDFENFGFARVWNPLPA